MTLSLNKLQILLLNNGYEALRFIGWKDAVGFIIDEKVDVIENTFDGNFYEVHSPSTTIVLPSVLRLKNRARFSEHRYAAYSSINVLIRDDYQCQLRFKPSDDGLFAGCTAPKPGDLRTQKHTIDHLLSRYYGGETSFQNCVAACQACNQYKQYYLHRVPNLTPKQPSWLSIYLKKYVFSGAGPEEWTKWLAHWL